MIEKQLEIPMSPGTASAVLFQPEGDGPWPGVLYLTDIGGMRTSNRGMAKRVAAEDYRVLLPNVFYRAGEPPFAFPLSGPPEAIRRRIGEITIGLTTESIQQDAARYLSYLEGPIVVVGFCFNGATALRIAAAYPERIAAVASFHGGGLYNDSTSSPHLALPLVKARLYFGHATQDRSMSAEAIQKFEDALTDWGGRFESEVYESAFHGWTVPDSAVYNEPQAERAFSKLSELLSGTLR